MATVRSAASRSSCRPSAASDHAELPILGAACLAARRAVRGGARGDHRLRPGPAHRRRPLLRPRSRDLGRRRQLVGGGPDPHRRRPVRQAGGTGRSGRLGRELLHRAPARRAAARRLRGAGAHPVHLGRRRAQAGDPRGLPARPGRLRRGSPVCSAAGRPRRGPPEGPLLSGFPRLFRLCAHGLLFRAAQPPGAPGRRPARRGGRHRRRVLGRPAGTGRPFPVA